MRVTRLDPVQELEAITHALLISEDAVKQGGSIDLSGVDEQVEMLCREVVKTEGPLRLKLLPMLENVIQLLDRIEGHLRNVAGAGSGDDAAERRLRAQNAYGQKMESGA